MITKKKHPTKDAAYVLVVGAETVGTCIATYTSKSARSWDAKATIQGVTQKVEQIFSAKRAIDTLNGMFDFTTMPTLATPPRAVLKHAAPTKVDLQRLPELRNRCNALLVEYYTKAKILFPTMTISLPSMDFNKRGLSAGTATYSTNHISINPIYLVEQANNNFIEETIPHELAHLIAYNVYGRAGHGHGRKWQRVMRTLGQTPDRCHNYDGTNARVRQTVKYEISCGCQVEKPKFIGAVRAARMRKGTQHYICKGCSQRVVLV